MMTEPKKLNAQVFGSGQEDGKWSFDNSGDGTKQGFEEALITGNLGEALYKKYLVDNGVKFEDVSNPVKNGDGTIDYDFCNLGVDLLINDMEFHEVKSSFDAKKGLVFIEDWSKIYVYKDADTGVARYKFATKGWWNSTQADYVVFADVKNSVLVKVPRCTKNHLIYKREKNNHRLLWQNNWKDAGKTKIDFKSNGRWFPLSKFWGIEVLMGEGYDFNE